MAAPLYTLTVRDPATIQTDWLRCWKNGMIARGIASPNIAKGGDAWIESLGFSNEAAVVEANAVVKADQNLPDTAMGSDLLRIGTVFGVLPRPASGAVGNLVYGASASQFIAAGTTLTDALNQRFTVVSGQVYNNGDILTIQAQDLGASTNHPQGDSLTWTSAPTYANPTQLVGTGGLTGGADAENDDTYRTRILSTIGSYPASGNWQFVASLAEASSPVVQKAFVAPAIRGPATLNVTVVGYAQTTGTLTSTSKNRNINATLLANTIAPYVKGLMPEHVDVLVLTASNLPVDVSFGMSLPSAPTASPPGPGGGWLDGTPWPAISGTAFTSGSVLSTATTPAAAIDPSSTTFVVFAPTLPQVGTHVSWVSPLNWTVYSAVITASQTDTTNQQRITISSPFVGIAAGNMVFPTATNTAAYVTAVLTAFANMGPGENSASAVVLQRAFRHPQPQQSWPYSLGPTQLRALTNAGTEVLDTNYYFRGQITPTVPGSTSSAPFIFVPANIGFYAI